MRMPSVAAALCTVAMVAAGCTSVPVPPPSPAGTAPAATSSAPGLDRFYSQQLSWTECGQRTECAELMVPRDYGNPQDGDLQIAVARYRANDDSTGSLVYNPGGPGGSGVDFAKAAPYVVSKKVLDSYDFVSFDPRGVAGSDPVECIDDQTIDKMIAADPDPDTPAEVAALTEQARLFGRGCQQHSPDLVGFIDTGSVVKDMDVLRAALGEERLNYLGSSYGTKLGALYAEEFGPHVGRMVLNGVLPPDLSGDEIAMGQAEGFEDALRQYVAWCQQQSDCPVAGKTVDAGVAKVKKLLDRLDAEPLQSEGRSFTEGLAIQGVLFLLYYPYNGDWQTLNSGLRAVFDGNPKPLLDVIDQRMERQANGSYRRDGNSYEALVAVSCLDDPPLSDATQLGARAKEWARQSPVFGPVMAWSGLVCADWPVAPKGEPRVVTAEDAGPIVLVAGKHDPATPYKWAQRMADHLADVRLVTWDSNGHTAYSNGSQCVDSAVDDYLVAGTLPEPGLVCK